MISSQVRAVFKPIILLVDIWIKSIEYGEEDQEVYRVDEQLGLGWAVVERMIGLGGGKVGDWIGHRVMNFLLKKLLFEFKMPHVIKFVAIFYSIYITCLRLIY